ncbi:MAG: hypothetical protein ACKOPO_07835 [Novosphingobium sp.]
MGREAMAECTWAGQNAEARVQLESQEIILRGAIKARIARSGITGFAAEGDFLRVVTGDGTLSARLGAKEAEKWAQALAKPAPSLASKLGIGGEKPAFLLGGTDDDALLDALAGHHQVDRAEQAAFIVALIESERSLDAALELAGEHGLMLWCVYPKGKTAPLGDSAIRGHMRGAGWMDNKSCAVSERLTATRYARK